MPFIDVKSIAKEWKQEIIRVKNPNTQYKLTVIQVGNDPASNSYIKGKNKDCEEIGISFTHKKLRDDISENDLKSIVKFESRLNPTILQLPIPKEISVKEVLYDMAFYNDVDGLALNSDFVPCTPKGIIYLLKRFINLDGARVCIIGRSDIVGKPLALRLLVDENATVTLCHSHTRDIPSIAREYDVIVCAAGHKWLVDDSYVSDKTKIIVDVGINRENGKLYGDVNGELILSKYPNILITPVPGGVGLLTRCALMENVIKAYE